MSKRYRIIILESSPLLVAGIRHMLYDNFSYDVLDSFDCTEKLLEKLGALKPDIILLNPILLGYAKRFMLKSLFQNYPDVLCLALVSSYIQPGILKQFHAVIGMDDDKATIESKLREALRSGKAPANHESYELSDRERDVLIAVAKGKMNKEIADELNISIHTVISHRKNISRKTGIKSVSGLTVYALLNNMIDENDVH